MDITYEQTFNGYPINTDREKEMGCYTKGLAILQDKLESMMESTANFFSQELSFGILKTVQ